MTSIAPHNHHKTHHKITTETSTRLQSAIYHGWLEHRRKLPKHHEFRYQVFMVYLDLSELDKVFEQNSYWSIEKFNIASFKRRDYLGNSNEPLDIAVRKKVQEETGTYPDGPIRMLTNIRFLGINFNPITCYYIFNHSEKLEFIIAEVTNTPWGERHAYVLRCDPSAPHQRIRFKKALHVSPFNPMSIEYEWCNNTPAATVLLHMRNWRNQQIHFDATLSLTRNELNGRSMTRILISFPFITLKVITAIYWQALKLWLKRVPVYQHFKHQPTNHKT